MFHTLLIANRGEIACRVAATARRLGLRTVAVYSDADAGAMHVRACDLAVRIGPAEARQSYLDGARILQAARDTGAQAIHPGYGFLSENAAFAEACAAAGFTFVGPPPGAIRAMGLKSESKRLMETAGVPLVPGYHGADQDPGLLAREAARIGFPVLIKASAGGGGRGMRVVLQADDFAAALASCQREAQAGFGDAAVLVERYVTRPRHIEIQVFGDCHGNLVHLFERDCSVQRRHQKVLEEAPAPGLSPALRARMGEAAIAAARAVGYVGAGTVEFIVERGPDGQPAGFWFMEMNTRLQVEHPVTEAITGLDLVEWQLRVAAGEPLPLRQQDLVIDGHAIEARICAENPQAGFLPATGTLHVLRTPPAQSFRRGELRLDSGVVEGAEITPHYDAMVAKLVAWGRDRTQALARLDAGLAGLHVVGVHTNVAFLRRVAASRSFSGADLDTALIEREGACLFAPAAPADEWIVAGVVARRLAAESRLENADPFSRRDGWRLHGSAFRGVELDLADRRIHARVERRHRGGLFLEVAGQRQELVVGPSEGDFHTVTLGGVRQRLAVYAVGELYAVFTAQGAAQVREVDPLVHAADAAPAGPAQLRAPMPGRLVSLMVQAGDAVTRGQPLAIVEAMKMEHTLTAPADAIVTEVLFAAGDQVSENDELLRLAVDGARSPAASALAAAAGPPATAGPPADNPGVAADPHSADGDRR